MKIMCTHKKVWDTFNIKIFGAYQSDTLPLDIFEKFRDMYKSIWTQPCTVLLAPGLAWQSCLKKTGVKLELLTDYDMFLMNEAGIRGGICQSIYRYAEANNKYMKSYNKNKLSSYLLYSEANNLYEWAMCKKLPIGNFWWATHLPKYTESFIKNYDENSDWGSTLEVDIEYPKHLWSLHNELPFLAEKKKLGKVEKLNTNFEAKEN